MLSAMFRMLNVTLDNTKYNAEQFDFNSEQCSVKLTLASVTSEWARQVWGGAPGAPPIYLGSRAKFSQKIMFP